ncbi:VRR-NUC domain-containing protein [Fibrella sp. HMF5335]|uniref:VRR-NUC domain-containing protein n=2 Tax=Fibrella rubiginis TaxID=2817060 RepID=A0A939GJE6_9BACT|nr:VRR-NUC domain-containing protein [Fibrella rubiginis]
MLVDAAKAAKHPTLPPHARIKAKYSDKSANDLTRCIVDFFTYSGHFATRLQSVGTYREDLKKFVGSQQRRGLPDVFAVVHGRAVHVEIKVGKDQLSNDQKEAIADLQKSGAAVYVARDFQGFFDWFNSLTRPPFI